ncbi:MAG: PUA domain-containing protein [Candidatus Woesearchaeota archaeon]
MRKQYSKSEIKELNEKFSFLNLDKKSNVVEDDNKIYVNNEIKLINIENFWLPHLKLVLKNIDILPKVTVDMGAIKFVVKGADIMRPGITQLDEFSKGSLVIVIDETHNKPLSICKSLFSSQEINEMKTGKVLQNLHYIGDDYWNV